MPCCLDIEHARVNTFVVIATIVPPVIEVSDLEHSISIENP